MNASVEQTLLSGARRQLSALLAEVGVEVQDQNPPPGAPDSQDDAVWQLQGQNAGGQMFVHAFRRFTPRDVERVTAAVSLVRRISYQPTILVAAPWLSARSQQAIIDAGYSYLDLTGNVRLSMKTPPLLVRLQGATENPDPIGRPPVRLQGTQLGGLIRTLVEVAPPYRMTDLARTTGLSNAYVSRSLDALHDERLIERDPKTKLVKSVDWRELLLARAETYDLFKANRARTFITRPGAQSLYQSLGQVDQAVVTGSFAAYELVQIAVPAQLTLYVPNTAAFAEQYDLLPTHRGADVVLLNAASPSQLVGARRLSDGTFHAAISQVALDCLAGNGRLPEEGAALLDWMAEHLTKWRATALPIEP